MTNGVATTLEDRIREQARALGFDPVGIATLGPSTTHSHFVRWLAAGFGDGMTYLERGSAKRSDFRLPFEGARSAIVVGLDYGGREPDGPVARYARGDDYHDVIAERLSALHRWIESEIGRPVRGKPYVDTGPILERELAQRAGLGWIGKNTMLINPGRGSFFFLGALFLELELQPDQPFDADRCGTCTRCIDACPTDAIISARVLDARRCISYLTIEHRGEFPAGAGNLIGDHIYGCDICQDVCPWNVSFAQELAEPAFAPREVLAGKDADTLAQEIARMSTEDFSREFRKSPMKRARLEGLKRNAKAVLRNGR